ncbi:very-long-chain 3-oxoacyl-CoA reductase-B-like [Pelobates fuscus]|uniref:very-long-chain 3-oxoacyl-CoA reductase-B-like n=1 Tax=Pelobates fuscus TaxID=191477 RepID=UPI002FE43DFD
MEAKADYTQAFVLFGKVVAIYLLVSQGWKLVRGIRNHIVSGWFQTDLKQYGRWAVVTGASDGIGKSYARELAKRGLDVVLISRTLEKLKNVASEIEQKYGRKTKIIQTDFTRGSEMYQSIEDNLKGMEIGILVNNVGMILSKHPERFLNIPNINKAITDTINCNILSVLQMTRIVLPQMIERNKGLIINISSEAGNHPFPLLIVYSATKVFVDFFSRGLHTEYQSKGITVQCVMPLSVSTPMTSNIKTNIFVKSAGDFAREALNTVGYTNRTSCCFSHSLQVHIL